MRASGYDEAVATCLSYTFAGDKNRLEAGLSQGLYYLW